MRLKMMNSPQARRQYILDCMNSTIDYLLKGLKKKFEYREKQQNLADNEYELFKERINVESKDPFSWLKINSK